MGPVHPSFNATDCGFGNSVLGGDYTIKTRIIPDRVDIALFEFGGWSFRSTKDCLWMFTNPRGFALWSAALPVSVHHVLFVRGEKQVSYLDASRRITCVTDTHSVWDRTIIKFPHNSCALVQFIVTAYVSISARIKRSSPNAASSWRQEVTMLVKRCTKRFWCMRFSHGDSTETRDWLPVSPAVAGRGVHTVVPAM